MNKNILIRNNVIEAVNEHAIAIEDAEDVQIVNNDISGCLQPVYMNNTQSVVVKNIRYLE